MAPLDWVLLVEDEADHRVLVTEALQRLAADVDIHEVGTADAAIRWMKEFSGDGDSLQRGVVVLDLGLPGASGFRVLEWMHDTPPLDDLAVVVLTSSENPLDAEHAFNLGARGYFQKPADFRRYLDIFTRVFKLADGSRMERNGEER